jgi:hypothetical protein
MDAKVTLILSPSEFDVIRRAVDMHESNQNSIARDSNTDAKLRQEARVELSLTVGLKAKLNS